MAIKDPLTGLANRTFFEEALGLALRRRDGEPGVLFCDMNNFKQVNDRLGHQHGDHLLQITAQRLTEAARDGDLVARLAGDEFVIVCPEVHSVAELEDIATRLRGAVCEPVTLRGVEIMPHMSIGCALACEGDTSVEVLARADHAMYAVKADRLSTPRTAGRRRTLPAK